MYNPYESSLSDFKGGERINETGDKIFTEQSKFKGKNKKSNEYMSKEEPFTTNKTIKYYQGTNKAHYYLTSYVRVKVISISVVDY
jgi:hypothetical protein